MSDLFVKRQKFITRADLLANPRTLYVFGDNVSRTGMGGQAKEMRGEKNAYGVATKRRPEHGTDDCYFWDHNQDDWEQVKFDLDWLEHRLTETIEPVVDTDRHINYVWISVVIPEDGIGTGLARLKETAPKMLAYINKRLNNLQRRPF